VIAKKLSKNVDFHNSKIFFKSLIRGLNPEINLLIENFKIKKKRLQKNLQNKFLENFS